MAPGNTPEPLMQAMAKAITDALAWPELLTRLNDLDMNYEGLTGNAATQRLNKLFEEYGRVIRATDMKVD
jgi:tripartite-type tricarboxylate transporter receptor subunit TctC